MLQAQQGRYVSSFSIQEWQFSNEDNPIFDRNNSQQQHQQRQQQNANERKLSSSCQSVILVSSCKDKISNESSKYKRLSCSAFSNEQFRIKKLGNYLDPNNNSTSKTNNNTTAHTVYHPDKLTQKGLVCATSNPQINVLRGSQIISSRKPAKSRISYSPSINVSSKKTPRLPEVLSTDNTSNKKALIKVTKTSKVKLKFNKLVNRKSDCVNSSPKERLSVKSFSKKKENTIQHLDKSTEYQPKQNFFQCGEVKRNSDVCIKKDISLRKKVYYSERQSGVTDGAPSAPPSTPAYIQNETISSFSDLKSQRNVIQKLLKIGSKQQERDKKILQKAKEAEKARKESEKQELIASQRRQIYYLNNIMTKLENDRFIEFKTKQSGAPV